MTAAFCLLVVAKAPVPGFAKTRLCPPATGAQAAEIAASALLDTLDAVLATPGAIPMVAMTGDLSAAARSTEISEALQLTTVFPQRGNDFAAKLANAHADTAAAHPGLPVVQIGMDTPQLTPEILAAAADSLAREEAVLGPAADGGWWALGLRDPRQARVLVDVPMSTDDTGELTVRALTAAGLFVRHLTVLSDVDTMADACQVAKLRPGGRFAIAVAAVRGQEGAS
jgi:rSAM/selenodomain-associated transferase 1